MGQTAQNPCSRIQYSAFADDVLAGLSVRERFLPIKWTYNDAGSELFEEITKLQEYYLSRIEMQTLRRHAATIAELALRGKFSTLVELGGGGGQKADIIISQMLRATNNVAYSGIDISNGALMAACKHLRRRHGGHVSPMPIEDEFVSGMQTAMRYVRQEPGIALVMFLGSSIGNFPWDDAVKLLGGIRQSMQRDDQMLVGFDLKKDPTIMQAAYADPYGVTARFNLNLLQRINNELGGNFDLDQWQHHAYYDPRGAMMSYLLAKSPQSVWIEKLGKSFEFATHEQIYTECSGKYSIAEIEKMANQAGFAVMKNFHEQDEDPWFCDSLWQVP